MSGTLSKIEAIDDFDTVEVEPVDAAVDRVFGGSHPPSSSPSVEPNSAPVQAKSAPPSTELGTPMAPIEPRRQRGPGVQGPVPRPPRPTGPRPNINIERPAPDKQSQKVESTPAAVDRSGAARRTAPPQQSQPRSAQRRSDQNDAAKRAKEKAVRLPPRRRKQLEAQEAARREAEKAEAAKPKAAPKAENETAAQMRKVATPEALQKPPKTATPTAAEQKSAAPAPAPIAAPSAPVPTAEATPIAPMAPLPVAPATLPPAPELPVMPGGQTLPPMPFPPLRLETDPAAGGPPKPPPPPGATADGDGGDDGGIRLPPLAESPHSPEAASALAALKEATDLSNCLLPLLHALNWRGDPRHIAEALPHFTNALDITSMRNIMATLHFASRPLKTKLTSIDDRLFPCLFLPESGDAMILLGYEPAGIRVYDGGANEERLYPRGKEIGTAYFFNPVDDEDIATTQSKVGWFRAVSERFRSLIYQTFGITLILNILALVTPLFVMAVYDKVVATGSLPTLAFFAFGVSVAIGCDLILRSIRSKIMAFIGARLDNIVGIAIFHKILFLPPAFTERATIGAQVARIKDFETIRDFFTGPMALVLFELPFVVIFIATIAFLGGPVALISLIMMACFLILGLVITPLLRNSVSRAARASSKKQELIVETLSGMRAVKYCGAEHKWMERFREYSASAALNSFYTAQLSALMQTLSHVLMISAGLGTIIFGVFRVINGDMSVGGLVASMILVWRVLAPLQTGFVSLTRITQVKSSITQINNLMNIRGEREQHTLVNPIKQMEGYVTFARVSIRYSQDADPALVGVSLEIEPGEVLCVVGGNGSGKSTVLKLLAGMYAPQAGSIRIDNMDIRQMDTVELRHAVGYVPQTIQFFYGTIAQNLRLANPTATEEDIYRACKRAAVLEDVLELSQGSGKWKRDGFEVRIGDSSSGQMPTSLLQRLNLARGYLKKAPIMLFDEPGNGLDFAGDQAFMKAVDDMRGETTIMMVTHRPSHMKLADKILWLEHGNVRAFGPAAEVLQQMPKDFV